MPPWSRVRHRIERELARKQEQLGVARALIEDATRDTVLWLQADPSAVEREHVLAIQAGLADLSRIVERRMERRVSPKDGWEWAEAVADVLSHLEKAKQVRGNVVGKGLARLADHLPRELQGNKRKPKPPEPIRPVNATLTSMNITGYSTSKASEVPHDPPTYFPSDLWPQTNVILLEGQRKLPLQTQTLELCRHIIAEMTPIFVEAVKAGKIKASNVQCESGGGMKDLLRLLLIHNDPGPPSSWGLSNAAYQLGREVEKSQEWLALAKAILEAQRNRTPWGRIQRGAERLEAGVKQTESSPAANSEKTAETGEVKPTNGAAGPASWQEIEIVFLSDHRVEICSSSSHKTYNYAELGFQDRRNGKSEEPKPNRAWLTLCEMAQHGGTLPRPSPGTGRAMLQKRIEEIRKGLRYHFGIGADPIPFNGNTYQTSFKIKRGPSFNT